MAICQKMAVIAKFGRFDRIEAIPLHKASVVKLDTQAICEEIASAVGSTASQRHKRLC
jgi:hypothetical protein